MKKKIKILSLILSTIFLLCTFFACELPKITGDKIEGPEPSTTYTEEEQVERILKRTEEKFARDIETGKLIDIHVEIVYSFDNKPKFFLVQLYYEPIRAQYEEQAGADYAYIIGYMHYDKLRTGLPYYDDFIKSRNPYLLAGYENYKKYYGGGVHAIEKNGQMIQIFEPGNNAGLGFSRRPELWEKKVIDPSHFEYLTSGAMFPTDY